MLVLNDNGFVIFKLMLEKKTLARKFCPVLRMNNKEKYTPTNFIELFKKPDGKIDFKGSNPEVKWNRKAIFDKETDLYWFSPTAYVHFLEDIDIEIRYKKRRVPFVIQYFYYFAYNIYYWGQIQVPFLNHRHDWEVIQVALEKVGAANNYEVLSYSISAHGTFVEINDQRKIKFHKDNGFHCNRGAHNFGSIFYLPNRHRKKDIIIRPDTSVPVNADNRIAFGDSLIFLDEFKLNYLNQFSFSPLQAPWNREFYHSATWLPEYWSWSLNRQIKQLFGMISKEFVDNPEVTDV